MKTNLILFFLSFFFFSTSLIAADNCPIPENLNDSMCSGTFVAESLTELQTYQSTRGLENGKLKHLLINFNHTGSSNLSVSTPCQIKIASAKNITLTNSNLCLTGAERVEMEDGVVLDTGTGDIEIHSEKSIVVKPGSTFDGGYITLQSYGQDDESRVHLRERTTMNGGDLKIHAYYRTSVDKNSNLSINNSVKIFTGKLNRPDGYIQINFDKIFSLPVSQLHIGRNVIVQASYIDLQSHYHLLIEKNVQLLGSSSIHCDSRSFSVDNSVQYPESSDKTGYYFDPVGSLHFPKVDYTVTASESNPLEITFQVNDLSPEADSDENEDEESHLTRYYWDFMEGSSEILEASEGNNSTTFTFPMPGRYHPLLTVVNNYNRVAISNKGVEVNMPDIRPHEMVLFYFRHGKDKPNQIAATLGTTNVTLSKSELDPKIYGFLVPTTMTQGSYEFSVPSLNYSSSVEVLSALTITDASTYMNGQLNSLETHINNVFDDDEQASFKQWGKGVVQHIKTEFSKLSAEDQQQTALLLKTNMQKVNLQELLSSLTSSSQRSGEDFGQSELGKLNINKGLAFSGLGLILSGGLIFNPQPLAGTILIASGVALAGFSVKNLVLRLLKKVEKAISSFVFNYQNEDSMEILSNVSVPFTSSVIVQTLSFNDRNSPFRIPREGATIVSDMNDLIVKINNAIDPVRNILDLLNLPAPRFSLLSFPNPPVEDDISTAELNPYNLHFYVHESEFDDVDTSIDWGSGTFKLSSPQSQTVTVRFGYYNPEVGEVYKDVELDLVASCSVEDFVSVNPRGTYLFTDPRHDDQNLIGPASSYTLPSEIESGDFIELRMTGTYDPDGDDTSYGDTLKGMVAVLVNQTGTFLSPGESSGHVGFLVTRPTSPGGLPTDIPQDFALYKENVTELQVPEGAHRILFSADDVHFSNNIDRNGDYGAYVRYHVPITNPRCSDGE